MDSAYDDEFMKPHIIQHRSHASANRSSCCLDTCRPWHSGDARLGPSHPVQPTRREYQPVSVMPRSSATAETTNHSPRMSTSQTSKGSRFGFRATRIPATTLLYLQTQGPRSTVFSRHAEKLTTPAFKMCGRPYELPICRSIAKSSVAPFTSCLPRPFGN